MIAIRASLLWFLLVGTASAQTPMGVVQNQIWTPQQWNAWSATKQDYHTSPPGTILGNTSTGAGPAVPITTLPAGLTYPSPVITGTITGLGVIPLTSLAAIADQRLLCNATGGAASPAACTATAPLTLSGSALSLSLAAPLTTSGGALTIAAGGVSNAMLANPATTVAGQTCTLGASCSIASTNLTDTASLVYTSRALTAGSGLTGGGTLAADRSFAIANFGTGTALDNLAGLASTGLLNRTGAGTYAFKAAPSGTVVGDTDVQTLTNKTLSGASNTLSSIGLSSLTTITANTIVANPTGLAAAPTAMAVTSCSTSNSALNWTTSSGIGCNTAVNAATLGGATFAAPAAIGSTTPAAGSFTTLSATGHVTLEGVTSTGATGTGKLVFNTSPVFGTAGSSTGSAGFAGLTSGTVTVSAADAAGTWTLKLPTSAGGNNQYLTTDGAGNTSWTNAAGTGTVNTGTAGQFAYYATSTNAISPYTSGSTGSGAVVLATSPSFITSATVAGSFQANGGGDQSFALQTSGTNKWLFQIIQSDATNRARIYDSVNSREAVTFLSSGNVGVGTSTPRGLLHVQLGGANNYSFIQGGTVNGNGTQLTSTDTIPVVSASGGFTAYNGLVLMPKSWGGTTTDQHNGVYIGGNQRNFGAVASTLVYANWGYFTNTGTTAGGLGNATAQNDAVKFKWDLIDLGAEFTQSLALYSRSASATDTLVFNILSNGNVGLGVSPSYKLDASGDINTSGVYRVNGSSTILTLNAGTSVGLTVPGAMTAGSTYTIGSTSDHVQFGSLGLGGAAANATGMINAVMNTNGQTALAVKRATDTSPTGNFLIFQNAAGGTLFSMDITGVIGTNLGIGVSPSYKLDVNGDINFASTAAFRIGGTNFFNKSGNFNVIANPDGSSALLLGNSSDQAVYIRSARTNIQDLAGTSSGSGGRVNIGWDPSGGQGIRLKSANETYNQSLMIFTNSSDGLAGYISQATSSVAYNTSSDRRLKSDIADSLLGLQALMNLRPRRFTFRGDDPKRTHEGLIAQEVYRVYPEAVTAAWGDDGEGTLGDHMPWGVDYGKLTPLLVKALQEEHGLLSSAVKFEAGRPRGVTLYGDDDAAYCVAIKSAKVSLNSGACR